MTTHVNISLFEKHTAYRVFLASMRAKRTKEIYSHGLNKYYLQRPENKGLTLDQILSKTPREIEYEMLGIIEKMKERQMAYNTIASVTTAILHFFEINDLVLNKKRLVVS